MFTRQPGTAMKITPVRNNPMWFFASMTMGAYMAFNQGKTSAMLYMSVVNDVVEKIKGVKFDGSGALNQIAASPNRL
jgi:hypothetical protein